MGWCCVLALIGGMGCWRREGGGRGASRKVVSRHV